jgi:hypothetical protein
LNRPGRKRRPHLVRLMADHYRNVIGWRDLGCGAHHMFNERQATGAVQHLGAFRFHPCAQACGQDHYLDVRLRSLCQLVFSEDSYFTAGGPSAPRQFHSDIGGHPRIVPDNVSFGQQIGGDNL